MEKSNLHVAVVGATGAVGRELISVLERRGFPVGKMTLLASSRSERIKLEYRGGELPVKQLNGNSFKGVDFAFFCAGEEAASFVATAIEERCMVIDNSSMFRMQSGVPLVIPEINADDIKQHHGLIASPNCTTTIMLMALYPLHQAFGVRRVIASSYQAVSGSGTKGIKELERQMRQVISGEAIISEVYPQQIAVNVIPEIGSFSVNGGYSVDTDEEHKMQAESRKIMDHPQFRTSVTCVRVPVYRAHSVAVSAEFEKPINESTAREVLKEAPGLEVVGGGFRDYPTPLSVSGRDNCQVGRIRKDNAWDNGLSFWVSGDQLLKGAALNAVQIAELLL